MRLTLKIFLIICVISSIAWAKPEVKFITGNPYTFDNIRVSPDAFTKAQIRLDANRIDTWIWNTGVFNQDMRTQNTPGLMWPKGQNKFAIFTSGLTIGTYMNGNLRLATASYAGEYQPGYCDITPAGPVFKTNSDFKIYKIVAGDNATNNLDYANWGLMVPYGAPYVDVDGNRSYTPGVDKPGIKDASQTIFVCLTDADPNTHSSSEGFSGGTLPIYAELHLTAWGYSTPGLEDMNFVNWVVINKSGVSWDSTHFGIVVDPDLGYQGDDYIGCDTSKNLGYCYNADDIDGTGAPKEYGQNPPCVGMDYFKSPLIPTGNPNDVDTTYFPPGSENAIVKRGVKQIGLTSFVYYNNGGSETCATDPSESPLKAYTFLKGLKKDGTPYLNPLTTPPTLTKFVYPGDPESGAGWTEYSGRIENCNGAVTGTIVAPTPPGDRRFIFNSGASTFKMNSLDTQVVVLGQFVAKGSNNKNAVTKLKSTDATVQKVFDKNFKVIPPPPPPVVNVSYLPNSTVGTFNVSLSWGDVSEQYNFVDDLFNQGTYKFQGYEIYEVRKSAQTLPTFSEPETINSDLILIDAYDLRDNIGLVIDTFKTGIAIGGAEQYAPFPIVPPYKMTVPAGFPNKGIQRNITLTRTQYASEYGGNDKFIAGNEYKFAVVAYGVVVPRNDSSVLKGGKVVRNSVSTQLITIKPESPTAGTNYYYSNGDTINNNRRDLGLIPIVVDQTKLLNAKYRFIFGSDTTYNVIRSLDAGVNWDTLRKVNESDSKFLPYSSTSPKLKLKANKNRTGGYDSSRVVDGVLMNMVQMRTTSSGNPNNVGVLKDVTPTLGPDSIQTRQRGWDYFPAQNNWLEGSKFLIDPARSWQSTSMSISYPTSLTYSGLGSSFKGDSLKRVKIVFAQDEASGQSAYRFVATGAGLPANYVADPSYQPYITNFGFGYLYQDRKNVPFKVYEVDPLTNAEIRQLNCGFLENNDTIPRGRVDGKWNPTSDSLGSGERLYIFNSTYDVNNLSQYSSLTTITQNLLTRQASTDIMYVWAPKSINASAKWTAGDQFYIYPYTVTRPGVVYEVETKQPQFGNVTVAVDRNALNDIRVVPNPYYGFNVNEKSSTQRFVTFRKLPVNCTIRIYTLNGDLVKKIVKNDQNSTVNWDLKNLDDVPVASGLYIALIDAPGIGQKTMKLAIFTPEERIDF
ncbi:MAG: hypothetical protein K1X86_11195 [Ignavibacteria bacterium]|nr:hypothetical protein [Ignavibacteria bacterium]